MHPGSGEMLKAALKQHKFAVAICRTAFHKTLIMNNLRSYVRTMDLVNFTADAPKKPRALIEYERAGVPAIDAPAPQPLPVPAVVPPSTAPKLASFGSAML